MLKKQNCKACGRSFTGGPRAYYCPDCRRERQKQAKQRYKNRKKAGIVREIGSTDTCERCSNTYTIEGSLQRFCPDCQEFHAKEYDRETSIEFYHGHKDQINPPRNERRRQGQIPCAWCGQLFEPRNKRKTCSDECRQARKNHWWNERYGK